MGQKVRPTGLRLGITEDWRSRWYAGKREFSKLLVEDFRLRAFVKKNYAFAAICKVEIERSGEAVKVILFSARPGLIIGRKGQEVENRDSAPVTCSVTVFAPFGLANVPVIYIFFDKVADLTLRQLGRDLAFAAKTAKQSLGDKQT